MRVKRQVVKVKIRGKTADVKPQPALMQVRLAAKLHGLKSNKWSCADLDNSSITKT